jgi:hypothetical protein
MGTNTRLRQSPALTHQPRLIPSTVLLPPHRALLSMLRMRP